MIVCIDLHLLLSHPQDILYWDLHYPVNLMHMDNHMVYGRLSVLLSQLLIISDYKGNYNPWVTIYLKLKKKYRYDIFYE